MTGGPSLPPPISGQPPPQAIETPAAEGTPAVAGAAAQLGASSVAAAGQAIATRAPGRARLVDLPDPSPGAERNPPLWGEIVVHIGALIQSLALTTSKEREYAQGLQEDIIKVGDAQNAAQQRAVDILAQKVNMPAWVRWIKDAAEILAGTAVGALFGGPAGAVAGFVAATTLVVLAEKNVIGGEGSMLDTALKERFGDDETGRKVAEAFIDLAIVVVTGALCGGIASMGVASEAVVAQTAEETAEKAVQSTVEREAGIELQSIGRQPAPEAPPAQAQGVRAPGAVEVGGEVPAAGAEPPVRPDGAVARARELTEKGAKDYLGSFYKGIFPRGPTGKVVVYMGAEAALKTQMAHFADKWTDMGAGFNLGMILDSMITAVQGFSGQTAMGDVMASMGWTGAAGMAGRILPIALVSGPMLAESVTGIYNGYYERLSGEPQQMAQIFDAYKDILMNMEQTSSQTSKSLPRTLEALNRLASTVQRIMQA